MHVDKINDALATNNRWRIIERQQNALPTLAAGLGCLDVEADGRQLHIIFSFLSPTNFNFGKRSAVSLSSIATLCQPSCICPAANRRCWLSGKPSAPQTFVYPLLSFVLAHNHSHDPAISEHRYLLHQLDVLRLEYCFGAEGVRLHRFSKSKATTSFLTPSLPTRWS